MKVNDYLWAGKEFGPETASSIDGGDNLWVQRELAVYALSPAS
jgi:hypothetical protein